MIPFFYQLISFIRHFECPLYLSFSLPSTFDLPFPSLFLYFLPFTVPITISIAFHLSSHSYLYFWSVTLQRQTVNMIKPKKTFMKTYLFKFKFIPEVSWNGYSTDWKFTSNQALISNLFALGYCSGENILQWRKIVCFSCSLLVSFSFVKSSSSATLIW